MAKRRTVLIFKSESDSTDLYAAELEQNNFHPIFLPTLYFGFKNLEKLHAKLQHPDDYAGIIFTSPRCIEAVVESLEGQEMKGAWKMLHNYAVGETTHSMASTLLNQLFTHGKQTGNARNLAEFIIDTFDGSKDMPFLLPCGNLAGDTLLTRLQDNGFKVDATEVYETKCNPELAECVENAMQQEEYIEYMAFFSPSGVNCAHEYFSKRNISLSSYKLIAIGPSTRRAMEQKGMTVFRTAERPSVEYLIKVLINPDESRERLNMDS